MAERAYSIRQPIDAGDPGSLPLELLADALSKTKPALVRQAAGEFDGVRGKLQNLYDVLGEQLAALDRDWPRGDDAKQVKEQLRRLQRSTHAVMQSIRMNTGAPPGAVASVPGGIAPALDGYAYVLEMSSGENVPGAVKDDTDIGETALQGAGGGAVAGAAIGSFFGGVGAVPGAVIGGIIGGVGGAAVAAWNDWGFNLWGESKEEANQRLADEHLKNITNATAAVNQTFPGSLETDVPQFGAIPPYVPTNALGPGGVPDGAIPGGPGGTPSLGGVDTAGLGVPAGPGALGPDGRGLTGLGPDGLGPDGLGADPNGTGLPGQDLPGVDPNGPNPDGLNDPDGTLPDGTGLTGDPALDTSLARFTGPDPTGLTGPTLTTPHVNGPLTTPNINGPLGPPHLNGPHGPNAFGAVIGANPAGGGPGGAGRLGGAGNSVLPFLPHGGAQGQGEEERERSTWLLEDDEIFTSDQAVTSPRIDHTPGGTP